jgi:hypothetical protein
MNSDIATSTSRKDTSACFKVPLSARMLRRENRAFRGTSGIGQENRQMGFRPAFYDAAANCVYPSCYADGRPAPCYLLNGLPDEVIIKRDPNGRVETVKSNLVAGFIRDGLFYSREQATQLMANQYKRARVLTHLGQALYKIFISQEGR